MSAARCRAWRLGKWLATGMRICCQGCTTGGVSSAGWTINWHKSCARCGSAACVGGVSEGQAGAAAAWLPLAEAAGRGAVWCVAVQLGGEVAAVWLAWVDWEGAWWMVHAWRCPCKVRRTPCMPDAWCRLRTWHSMQVGCCGSEGPLATAPLPFWAVPVGLVSGRLEVPAEAGTWGCREGTAWSWQLCTWRSFKSGYTLLQRFKSRTLHVRAWQGAESWPRVAV